jgi:hypothetical protein
VNRGGWQLIERKRIFRLLSPMAFLPNHECQHTLVLIIVKEGQMGVKHREKLKPAFHLSGKVEICTSQLSGHARKLLHHSRSC